MRTTVILLLVFVAIVIMPATSNALDPTAHATTTNVTAAGGTLYSFTVRYADDGEIDVFTLDNNDVRVTGPGGFSVAAAFVSVNIHTNGSPRIATYRIVPPGGSWNSTDNGTYNVVMQGDAVFDGINNPVAAGNIGSFTVMTPASPPPTARGDFNRDGFTDYLLFNPSTRNTAIWNLHGNAFIGGTFGPTLPTGWVVACVTDVNRDGKPDYVIFNASTRQTAIWFLNNATFLSGGLGPTLPPGWTLIASLDFNHDAKPDYVLFNASTRQTAIWFLNGTALTAVAYGPTLPPGWMLIDAVDFNADTKPDFVLANSSTRQTTIWYLNGTAHTAGASGPTLPVGWMLQGAADFNSNAKPDYVLFEASTRRTTLWYLNGATFVSSVFGPTLPAGYVLAFP